MWQVAMSRVALRIILMEYETTASAIPDWLGVSAPCGHNARARAILFFAREPG